MTEILEFGIHEEKPRFIGTSGHGVVPRPERTAEYDGKFGHIGIGDGMDEFCPVAGNSAAFILFADNKPGDVLQKQDRDVSARCRIG